jgi:hypothetical protein
MNVQKQRCRFYRLFIPHLIKITTPGSAGPSLSMRYYVTPDTNSRDIIPGKAEGIISHDTLYRQGESRDSFPFYPRTMLKNVKVQTGRVRDI